MGCVVRRRLDVELVRRGLAPSRTSARQEIEAGRVTVGGAPAGKPSRLVDAAEPVEVAAAPARFVSRGGEKLQAALDRFGIDVAGRVALDAGASTGGFTDCLLQAGAASVVAVDVGRAQLHERLRGDPRVAVRERTDVRTLGPDDLPAPPNVVVADVSFISLALVLPTLASVAHPDADLVVLVKPQFEAGRREADRGRGVIRDPQVWRRVLGEVAATAGASGLGIIGAMASPIRGPVGNVEFLLYLRAGAAPSGTAGLLDAAVSEARASAEDDEAAT
jgi:23S rRNA (cytidine1920-2'-O)/16S rRNA (cytidine1409-2'-O)-methyltransferase